MSRVKEWKFDDVSTACELASMVETYIWEIER
jgi:hypothetical protein